MPTDTPLENSLRDKLARHSIEQVRSNIERIIKSYRHTWDVYAELLQNSADALIEKFGEANISNGKILLNILIAARTIVIRDNGVGIDSAKLSHILVNGESLKREHGSGKFGFMGYGLTFVAFQSSRIRIESVHGGMKGSVTYNNLYQAIFAGGEIPQSEEEAAGLAPVESAEDSYTMIEITFPQSFPEESIERNIAAAFAYAEKASVFEAVLRTRTVVGALDSLFGGVPNFCLEVVVDNVPITIPTTYLSAREVTERALKSTQLFYKINGDYATVVNVTKGMPEAQRDQARRANLLEGVFAQVTIGSSPPLDARVYVVATSKDHINRFNEDINAGVSEGGRFDVEHGVWLAIGGMPTGICLESYEHSTYLPFTVVVDIVNTSIRKELDAGRKGITSYRAKQICERVLKLLRDENFFQYRRHVVAADTRVSDPLYEPKKQLQKLAERKKEAAIPLKSKWLPPQEEQEVIALFIELISKDHIAGYQLKVLSGYQVYDGLFRYNVTKGASVLYSGQNTLGIAEAAFDSRGGTLEKDDILVEFKQNLDGLFNDIDKYHKDVSHIDILVVWDEQAEESSRIQQERSFMLRERDVQKNPFYGVTHELIGLRQSVLPIISLRKVVELLFGFHP